MVKIPIYLCDVTVAVYKKTGNKETLISKHSFEKVSKGFSIKEISERILKQINGRKIIAGKKYKDTAIIKIESVSLKSQHGYSLVTN